VVYIGPIKSLCQEKLFDWRDKFEKFGISCIELTGDTENINFQYLSYSNIIVTTPEKWDSITRKWYFYFLNLIIN
jgi:ATP-dependent DNA helicase HFM1/MER3